MKLPKYENQKSEFKVKPSSLEKEIVAFANSVGGSIYIGVDDKGDVVGLKITNRMRSQIIDSINNCDPRPEYELEEVENIIILKILEGNNKPYRAPDGFYIRQGATSRKMATEEIVQFTINENRIQFDKQLMKDSVDLSKRSKFFNPDRFLQFRNRAKISFEISNSQLLLNLGFIKKIRNDFYPT